MANLLWKRREGPSPVNLVSEPFSSEEEFEKVVFETKGLLEDVYPLRRQVRGGSQSGRPDMIGLDADGNVCVIEMKNVPVDANILPQVLQYAFWAETNPDSIKNLWLESPNPPENLVPTFENYEVRIIVVAPSVEKTALDLVKKINYPIDLIEVKRWREGENQFLLVNKLEPTIVQRISPARGLGVYDRAFYESQYNKASVVHFLRFVEETDALVRKQGWLLERKFNKHYCGFKYGNFNAFGIKWMGSKSFAFFFKLSETDAQRATPKGLQLKWYDDQWGEAVFSINPEVTNVDQFLPLMKAAHARISGKR